MGAEGQEVRRFDPLSFRDVPLEKKINKFLAERYGKDDNWGGKPRFRVIWSADAWEERGGKHHEFTTSGIYLRTYNGIKKCPKYMWLVGNNARYVLEKLQSATSPTRLPFEIAQWDGYEILYVFQHSPELPLPLDLEIADIACYFSLHGTIHGSTYWKEQEAKATVRRVAQDAEAIKGEMYPLALHQGHTIINPYDAKGEKKNGGEILRP